jgi:hypothetical protein
VRQGERGGEGKQQLARALKYAHGRLVNHQAVTQVLVALAPLQMDANDMPGAEQMLTSGFTLAKGTGDVATQVGALEALQHMYARTGDAARHATNHNYLARKREDLSGRMQAAEADAAQHAAVAGWRLA